MPVSDDLSPRNFITKIVKYDKVISLHPHPHPPTPVCVNNLCGWRKHGLALHQFGWFLKRMILTSVCGVFFLAATSPPPPGGRRAKLYDDPYRAAAPLSRHGCSWTHRYNELLQPWRHFTQRVLGLVQEARRSRLHLDKLQRGGTVILLFRTCVRCIVACICASCCAGTRASLSLVVMCVLYDVFQEQNKILKAGRSNNTLDHTKLVTSLPDIHIDDIHTAMEKCMIRMRANLEAEGNYPACLPRRA